LKNEQARLKGENMKGLFNWHWLSIVIKTVLGLAALLVSAILSYTFFNSIKPEGMDVFPFAALSLTEGGLIGWILIFSTMRHHPIKGLIALIMVIASAVTTIAVTFAELIVLFQDHSLIDNMTIKNGTLILLEIMLAAHIIAALSDFLIGKMEVLTGQPPAPQKIVRQQPTQHVAVSYPQLAGGGETADPFVEWNGAKPQGHKEQ